MFLGSCSNDCFNLHTPSAPELFSRTAPAATAAALTMGRFGILMPSETSLSRQLWAYSRRSSSASAWRFGNQTATTCCYLQYRFSMPNIYIYNVRLESSSSLKKFKTKLLASSTLSSLWCQVEGNKHVLRMDRSTACLLATLSHGSLRNITTARRKNQMHWMHWTRTYRMYMDVHGCTMHSSNESLGGKGPSELMLSIHPAPQWLEVTNNVYIYIYIYRILYYISYI